MFKLIIVVFAALFAISMAAPEPEAKPQFFGAYPYSLGYGYGFGYGYPYTTGYYGRALYGGYYY